MQGYLIPKHPLADMIPEKEFKGYNCTNRGNVIGTINLPPLETAWSTTFETQKKLYGDRLIGSADSCDKDIRSERRDDSVEPTFYNFLPHTFYLSCMQAMAAAMVIDLASGPGEAAKAAMTLRLPYLGLCLSEKHALELQRHLTSWTLDCMAREGHQLYNPKYAEFKANEAQKTKTKQGNALDGSEKKAEKKDPTRKKAKGDGDESEQEVKKSKKDSKESKAKRKASSSPSPAKASKPTKAAKKKRPVISSSSSDSAASGSDGD
jgi:hypothetical protein